MKFNLSSWGPMTVLLVGIALIVVAVGGVVVVANPDALTFAEYTERLVILAGATGLLGVGRGVLEAKKVEARADVVRDPLEGPLEDAELRDLHENAIT